MPIALPQLQKNPSFGSVIGSSIAGGLQRGAESGTNFAQQLMMSKFQNDQRQKLINQIEGMGTQPRLHTAPKTGTGSSFSDQIMGNTPLSDKEKSESFVNALPQIEQELGRELEVEEVDKLWDLYSQQHGQPTREQDPFAKAKAYASAGEHELARLETERAKSEVKISEARRKERSERNFSLAKPSFEKANQILSELPQKEMALNNMKDAIESGDLGFFSLDNLADLTGIKGLRTPKGAEFKTASKEFFLGNLSRVGSKGLNQWMEKVVSEMAPQIGQSKEANLAMSEILQAENDVARKEAELTSQIADEYENRTGEIPRNLASLVEKELTPYAIRRQEETKRRIEELQEFYSPVNKEGYLMLDPLGNVRRVAKKDVPEAKKEGYKLKK
jgi:hypothetical protein